MPAEEYRRRRERVGSELAARKLDGLAVSSAPNLRYLTGFTGSNGLLLALPEEPIFFTDPRYGIQAELEVSCRVQVCKGPLLPALSEAVRRLRIRRLGFEPAHLTHAHYERLQADLPLKSALMPVNGWIERLRMVKSEHEQELLRCSARTNSRAFEQAARHVRAGMREADLAAELEYRMRKLGAEKPAFDTIVAAGARSALPHAQPTRARLEAGSLVLVDMGALENGYASDMTRMLHLGRPTRVVERLYRAVLEAQEAALAAVRPGVTAMRVDGAARRVLRSRKLDRSFVHSTGHGLGLEIHEPPRVGKQEATRLEEGMAITIEPGVYLEGFGGIRIEDTVLVTRTGCEILTQTSKQLRIV